MVSAMLRVAPVFLLIKVFNYNYQTFATFSLIGKVANSGNISTLLKNLNTDSTQSFDNMA